MAKASPRILSGNAGEWSPLVEGRVDLERYPSSRRRLLNMVAVPQGPDFRRPGVLFKNTNCDPDELSTLRPFVFSNEQAVLLEFCAGYLRFFNESGIVTEAAESVAAVNSNGPLVLEVTAHGFSNGDQVALSGFPDEYSVNGVIGNITASTTNTITLDVSHHGSVAYSSGGSASRVYRIATPYASADTKNITIRQTVDTTYVFCKKTAGGAYQVRKLNRRGATDWTIAEVEWVDGPFTAVDTGNILPTPSISGQTIPNMTGASAPTGFAATASGNATGKEPYKAFNATLSDYWESGSDQTGTLQIQLTSGFVATAYTIHIPKDNEDSSYGPVDYAPSTFTFEGSNDGSNWTELDQHADYVLYDGYRSARFKIKNATSYTYYRLVVENLTRNGPINPRVAWLCIEDDSPPTITLTFSSTPTQVNYGAGFVSTDVGRYIRLRGRDQAWRTFEITAVSSASVVQGFLKDAPPLTGTERISDWQIGLFSDTTGYPTTGVFFDDRFCLAGVAEYPDVCILSVTGQYENLAISDAFGVVLDASAIVINLNARRLGPIRWLDADNRGLLLATTDGEFVVSQISSQSGLSPTNTRSRRATSRGSSEVEPVVVDDRIVYLQRNGRTMRQFYYSFERDGYVTEDMSKFATHLGADGIEEMVFSAEPYSIIWARRAGGQLLGCTYSPDEQVLGFHQHTIAGTNIYVESLAVLPQQDQQQDSVWMCVRHTVNGSTVRHIVQMANFHAFGSTLADAVTVDFALKYDGTAATTLYGLTHLEGETVYGLADGQAVGPLVVENGAVALPQAASAVTLGLSFDSEGETAMIEAGAADGTSQGKLKRINKVMLLVWQSLGGQIATRFDDENNPTSSTPLIYEDIVYPDPVGDFGDGFDTYALYDGFVGPVTPEQGYGRRGTVAYRQPKETPYPLHVVSILPQITVEDTP